MCFDYKFFLHLLVLISFSLNANSNSSNIIENLKIEKGFSIEIFLENIDTPRQMAESDAGSIFVGSRSGGTIIAIDKSKNVRIIAKDLSNSTGVTYHNGDLYFSEVNSIWKIENVDETLSRSESIPEKKLVTNNLPSDTWHGWKWIDFGPDNMLYVPVGAPCNICNPSLEEKYNFDRRYASIMRLNGDEWEYVARGVRNTVGFDWHPETKKLYFGDNGRDWMGDDMPSCELNVVESDNSFFGYPYKHSVDIMDPEYSKKIPENADKFIDPILELGAHVAPTGLSFYDGDLFPSKYKNTLFMTLHGSWNRSRKVGYKVIAVHFDEYGELIYHKDFITGWLDKSNGQEKVLGRPAGVLQKSDGSILISDDGANVIYRVTYQKT
ncbi:MAG: sorbosone dehydrogenase [Gammaproteobacteria bacterium]|nr:MAG: sorbosone dehydrogenase [Gammaproteobacteria bacterium]